MVKHVSDHKSKSDLGKVYKSQFKSKPKGKKQPLKGINTWRDKEDDRTKEEIAKENFEKKKLYAINEKGLKVKKFKKQGVERPFLDLDFEDNEEVAYYDGFFVKRSAVEELDKLRESLELQEFDKITVSCKFIFYYGL